MKPCQREDVWLEGVLVHPGSQHLPPLCQQIPVVEVNGPVAGLA